MAKQNFIIGITGGSAAGKTEFLKKLLEKFDNTEVCLVSQDNYYLPRDQQKVDDSGYVNFDLPEAINAPTFAEHIKQLKNHRIVNYSEYSFVNEKSNSRTLTLNPAPVIIVEGIFVFHYPEIADLLDLKLYVDVGTDLMLKRRLNRDQKERGYNFDEIMYRFKNHVIPAYEKYTLPYKEKADIVIPNYDSFDRAFDVVATYLRNKIGNIKG